MWEPHVEGLRDHLHFHGNKGIFRFTTLAGKEVQASIKLLAEQEQDVASPVEIVQETERMLTAFDHGIALFVPTTTMTGAAITANTLLGELQQLSEDERQGRPFDIRVWNLEEGISERRIQALHTLIQNNTVSLVVSANVGQQDWTVYMARAYAIAINDCAERTLFSWDEVQQGEDIRVKITEVLQITFMELLNAHAIGGLFCSGDMVPDHDQGEEMGNDGLLIPDSDLAVMPRSITVLGSGHPFISTSQGTMANRTLAKLVELGLIWIIRKAGAGVIITEHLKGLMDTIRQCTATAMSPEKATKWYEIPMTEGDFAQLTETLEKKLQHTNFVWLFAGPGQLGTTPILELEMQDQARECEALTVCKLAEQDARFITGKWIFQAIHALVIKEKLVAQKVVNRSTQRNGWMIICPDANKTFRDQYGDLAAAINRIKSTKLGDDSQARTQLLQLEIDTLEQHLDKASDNIILVTGAKPRKASHLRRSKFVEILPRIFMCSHVDWHANPRSIGRRPFIMYLTRVN